MMVGVSLCLCLVLAGCGSNTRDRTASGAGIGAAAGAVVGAVTGLSVLQGAAAGGLTGALTTEDVINLGDPIWASDGQAANKPAVSRVQAGPTKLGYDPGPIDGVARDRTRRAIRFYQEDNGLAVNGQATLKLAQHIEGRLGGSG